MAYSIVEESDSDILKALTKLQEKVRSQSSTESSAPTGGVGVVVFKDKYHVFQALWK